MCQKIQVTGKRLILKKDLMMYIPLFIIFYLGVMLLKYLTNDNLTWLNTFIMMFSITFIYFLLRRTKKGD